MTYILLFLSLLCFSLSAAQEPSSFLCYVETNCSVGVERPVYSLADSLESCCEKSGILSALNHSANTCFNCAGDAARITPRSVVLYPPQSLVLEVAATGYEYIAWFINGSVSIDISRLTLESNSKRLVLSDTVSEDAGEYEADVHFNDGTVVILDFIVQPYVPPNVTISNPTESDIVRDHVNVTCTSQGNPIPAVNLYCEDLGAISTYPNVAVGDFGVIPIASSTIEVEASGADGLRRCYCSVSAYNGSAIYTANSSILLLPTSPYIKKDDTTVVSVTAPMRSEMRCEAYGRPSPVITWRFNGNIITSEDTRRNITDSVNGYRVDSTLLIASTSSSDHGLYDCTATNIYGNATVLITNLNVLFAPVVTASPHTYNINVNLYNEVSLTCVSTSNPESRVIWVGEGGVLNDVCAGNSDDFNGAEAGIEYSQIENMFHDFSGDLGVASPSPSAHPRNCTINIGTTTQTFPVSTSVLTLGSLLHENSMNFVCVGTNDIGDSLSTASISLSLDASPYFSQIPLAIPSLYVGSTVEYNCSVISVTPVNITWLLDGIVIDEEILESKTQNETTSTLVLYDIEVDDAGRYTCHAKNDNGTSSRSFIQQIRAPVLSLMTDDNVVQGDDSIEMTCTGEGNPLPAITWSYTNEVTGETRNLTSPGYTINTVPLPDHDYQIESELILSNATLENAGRYTCTATSAFQDQSTSTNVKVLVPAVITDPSSDQQTFSPILGATDFTILCAATGVSAPNVSIIRLSSNQSVGTSMKMKQLDTGLILSETSLVFNTVTSDAEGLYECQASNELAQLKHSFVVSVDDNTIFNTEFQVIDIVIESNLTISCNITTHASDPVINWYRSGVKLGTDTERVYASSSSSVRDGLTTLVSTLTISDVEVSDGGNYVCEVVNTHGSYNESISQVNVQVPPSVSVSPSNLTYIQGINANLSCIGTGPPLPSLQFDGVNCSPSSGPPILINGNRFSGYCQTVGDNVIASLTVSNITELGPLAIECSATNPAGDDAVLETIFITGLSLIATQPENISIPDGGFHTFSCAAQGYPLPDIQWGSENNLSLNHDITVDHVGQFGIISNLTIYNYTASNEGEYHCTAKNQYYKPVSSTTVVSTKYIAPSVITKLTTETVTINDNISIICTATGLPPPTVSWMKGGIPTMGNNLVSEVAVNIDGTPSVTTSTLTLAGVTLTDEGEYTCIASSPEFSGTVERIVKNITIIVPPVASIYPSSLVHFIPGHNNSLICAGTGKPAPTVSINGYQCSYADTQSEWTVNGIIIRCNAQQVGGIYSISMYYTLTESVTDFSPHNVTCLAMSSAFDTVETATSLVQYQVYESVLTQASFVTLPEGGTFNISCTSTGYPHPTLDWLYGDDNGAIVYNDRHIRSPDESINAYTVQSILTVKDLIPADAGEYKCRAQYSSGHLVHATSLAVTPFNDCAPNPCVNGSCTDLLKDYTCSCNNLYTGKNCSIKIENITSEAPNITENPANVTEAFLFGSFNVTCEAVAIGGLVQYSWLRDNVKLDESGDVLFISEAVPEDRGYYTCVAENEAGNSTSQPGLVVIPGLYQYVAAISTQASKATGQLVNIENITVAMGECLSYDVLPDQNTTIIYSVSQCHTASCATTNGLGSVLITLFQTAPPLQSDNLRDYLFNKLTTDLESRCAGLGVQVTDVWRFDGCGRESEVLHRDYGINITWPESEISNDIRRNCPCGRFTESDTYISGIASRQCRGSYSEGGLWLESDTSQCNYNSKNISITLSLCHLTTVTDVAELVQGLTEQSRSASFYEPLDFTIATLLAEDLAQSEGIVSNREVQNGYVEAIENLLLANSTVVNASQAMHGSGERLLRSLEIFQERIEIPEVNANITTDAANGTTLVGSISFQRDLIGIIVTKVNTNSFRNQTFSAKLSTREGGSRRLSEVSLTQESLQGGSSTASVHIPETLISKCPPNSSVRINYNVFLSSVVFQGHPRSYYGELVESGNLNVSNVILSASACRGNSIEGLVEPVILEFPKPAYLLANGTNTSVSTCVFWDPSIRDGSGGWSMGGCTTVSNQNEDVVRCRCDHLTHFGYLFDVEPKETEPGPETTGVEVITYIGIIVSILCLVITIFTFCGAKKLLERTHGKIVINMCLALIGLYIVFLIAGNASSIRSVDGGDEICAVIGALLYYFMLVYFMWTAIDAIDLYRKLVLVFYNRTPWFIIMACIAAWGLPLIIIGISIGAGYDNYLDFQSFCRPSGLPFYIGFLVPFGLVYIFDWAMFIFIFVKFCYKKKVHKSKEEKAFYINSKQLFFMAMILSINFGLGWGLGLAATAELPRELYLVFAYMFSLFVGMQGFLIFLLHCARSSIARNFWVYLFYIVCLCKKKPEAKSASGHKQATKTPFVTPGPRRKFDSNANSMGIPLSSRGSKPGSPYIVQNPVHGLSEAETDFAPARVFDEIDLLQELGPLEIMEQELNREREPEIEPKKKSVKEKKASKKMSKKESTTKMISKKISKLKLSKKESKKKPKAKESQSLLKTDASKKLSDSMNSLGDMSLTGSQALEIEFAPSVDSSSDEEEEMKWRRLSEQFDSINAMVNESFIESKKQKKRKEKASKALEEKDKITEEAAMTEEVETTEEVEMREKVEIAEETTEVEMTEEAEAMEKFEVPEIIVEEAIKESVDVAEVVTNTEEVNDSESTGGNMDTESQEGKEEAESKSKEETISNKEEPEDEEEVVETQSRDENEKEEEDKLEAQDEGESDEGASSDEEAALVVTVEREEIEVEIEEIEERASQTEEGGKEEEDEDNKDETASEKYEEKLLSSENDEEED